MTTLGNRNFLQGKLTYKGQGDQKLHHFNSIVKVFPLIKPKLICLLQLTKHTLIESVTKKPSKNS